MSNPRQEGPSTGLVAAAVLFVAFAAKDLFSEDTPGVMVVVVMMVVMMPMAGDLLFAEDFSTTWSASATYPLFLRSCAAHRGGKISVSRTLSVDSINFSSDAIFSSQVLCWTQG